MHIDQVTAAKIYSFAPVGRSGDAALSPSAHPHLTGLMRKFARLANFPNFFRFAPETSHKPDVQRNRGNSKGLYIGK